MNITQLITTGPVKALDLLARLTETSDGAVKTRQRLLDQLTSEIQLYAQLEEQHLIPVLRKHGGTRDLARDTVAGSRQTLKMLKDVEQTPTDSPEFLPGITALRQLFQQQVRNEKKQLPTMKKALTAEELKDLAEHIEEGRADAKQAQNDEAEQRRTAAREQRDAAQLQREHAEHRNRLRESAKQRRAAAHDQADATLRKTAEATVQGIQRLTQTSARQHHLTSTVQKYGEVWMDWFSAAGESASRATSALGSCNSPHLLAQAQMRYAMEMGQAWKDAGTRIMQITWRGAA